jgi:hypothetical protein
MLKWSLVDLSMPLVPSNFWLSRCCVFARLLGLSVFMCRRELVFARQRAPQTYMRPRPKRVQVATAWDYARSASHIIIELYAGAALHAARFFVWAALLFRTVVVW